MELLFNFLNRKKSSSNYFWIANAMDHRIFVEIKPIDEIGVKQVTTGTGVEFKPVVKAPAEIGDIGAAANINHNKTVKYEAKQHNTLYFEVCCMTAKRISYKKSKMVYIYKGEVTFSSTSKGEQLMSWIPKKGYALLIKNNSGDWYDETKMEGECNAIDAFQYKDSIGNTKSAFNYFNLNMGKEGHSRRNDVVEIKFYVANAYTKHIYINRGYYEPEFRIEAEDVKMIELSIYRDSFESSLQLELLEEIQNNTADAIDTTETPYKTLARTSYPQNYGSLIVTKDGCVTQTRNYVTDENDDNAWIDEKGKDHNPANNDNNI